MRITFDQRNELLRKLEVVKLPLQAFEVSSEKADSFSVKLRDDYFSFGITKRDNQKYLVTVRWVDNVSPVDYDFNWGQVLSQFETWGSKIEQDIRNRNDYLNATDDFASKRLPGMSPRSVEVYKQARRAELLGLDEVCGLGYRKAFEIMMKDYLIKGKTAKERAEIKRMPLSQCIKDKVANDEIKILAHRVLWLGNDHAHYVKMHRAKGMVTMKELIQKTVEWINNHEAWKRMEKKMQREARRVDKSIQPKGHGKLRVKMIAPTAN